MLTLLYGLRCTLLLFHFNFLLVFLPHLHVFNVWYYRISSNNARGFYFKINLGQSAKLRGNREETQRGKMLLYQIILVYANYEYIKTAEKITVRIIFSLLERKIGFNVKEEEWNAYL